MPEEICTNIIREKLLEHLPQEIPYSVQQVQAQKNDLEAPYQPHTQLGSRDLGVRPAWLIMLYTCAEDGDVGGRAKWGADDCTESSGAQRIPCGKQS